jgi:hypothetical protein
MEATSVTESKNRRRLKRYISRGLSPSNDEPTIEITSMDDETIVKNKMCQIFNWYSYHHDSKKAKQWILEYLMK